MPTTILQQTGTAIILADTTDHAPAAGNNLGTRTDQIDLTSLAAGALRQSAKIDFGLDHAAQWGMRAAVEFSVAPAAGETVNFYMAYSHSATAGTGNDGNCSGSDAAYNGYGAAAADGIEAVKLLQRVGSLVLTADADIQIGYVGTFMPQERYGMLVVFNNSGQAFIADAVEMSVRLAPIEDELQN